jgi:hypothetical protein
MAMNMKRALALMEKVGSAAGEALAKRQGQRASTSDPDAARTTRVVSLAGPPSKPTRRTLKARRKPQF